MPTPAHVTRDGEVEVGARQVRSRVGAAVGIRFQVVGPGDVVEAAHHLLADLFAGGKARGSAPVRPGDVLRYDVTESEVLVGDRRFDVRSVAEAIETIQWHLNQSVVERATSTMTGLHAAAAARGGRLVVLPADSGSGKSTTVAGLVRAGWQYVTDEACLIEPRTLRVLPYPKPIGLERGSWRLFPGVTRIIEPHGTWLVPAGSLGRAGVGDAMVPAAVVTPRYEPGGTTRLRRLRPGELVMELAQSTFSFNADGGRHLRVLARLARRVPGYVLTIADLDEAVDVLNGVATAEKVG